VSVEPLERAAVALDGLVEDVVVVGGASVVLWISDPAAPAVRPTLDVDVVVEVASRGAYYRFEDRLRGRGFVPYETSGVICRWRHPATGLVLDAMPADASILGFASQWQAAAIPTAIRRTLPSGRVLRVAGPVYLLATKLEAFAGRGGGDLVGSRDFGDVIALVDGRRELPEEVAVAADDVRRYIAEAVAALLALPRILDGIAGALRPDSASQARADLVVLPTLRQLAAAG
jgi:hypothetical protein